MKVRLKDIEAGTDRIGVLLDLQPAVYIQDARTRIDPAKIAAVGMEWAAVTAPDADYPALGTDNLATCMGIAVHNPHTKATGLAHLAQEGASTDLSEESRLSLLAMLDKLRGSGGALEARIVGPNTGGFLAEEFADNVADILEEYDVAVLSADFGSKAGMTAFAVHSGMWEEGLIRGKVTAAQILNAHAAGGKPAADKLFAEIVNLERMSVAPAPSSGHLAYDGLKERQPLPPEPA